MSFNNLVLSSNNILLDYEGIPPTYIMFNENTSNINLALLPQDVPLPLDFDGSVNGPSDAVQSDTSGLITFNEGGLYSVTTRITASKVGASFSLLTMNVVYNGTESTSFIADILEATEATIFNVLSTSPVVFESGDTLQYQIWTDSNGSNQVELSAAQIQYDGPTGGPITTPSFSVGVNRLYRI